MKGCSIILMLMIALSGCQPPFIECVLNFPGFTKTYKFSFSKEELKNRIVEAYTYDESLLLKNFGLTLIENEEVDAQYRQSIEMWLDKKNWDNFKAEIRKNTGDTLNLIIRKHHSLKAVNFQAILEGDANQSSVTLRNVGYSQRRACHQDTAFFKTKAVGKIENKLVRLIN